MCISVKDDILPPKANKISKIVRNIYVIREHELAKNTYDFKRFETISLLGEVFLILLLH